MNTIQRIALVLLIIGGLNWALIGLFQFDLVASIFGGQDSILSRIIYTLVGISALCCLPLLFVTDKDEREIIRGKNLDYSTEFAKENDPTEFTNNKEK
ncbi:DUF378 domain-containing protein [Gracilibacillus alcaliphilus]|uniref:DUF378 domain-containing protein n=1 Tax=Gracilibacillus alcaliphilus TaxID=1401441 RepID=UPI00195C671A|nr:DUF378 domain-containing protein [Gracilibacillus alcaliphilus]MBM7678349.1 uncharacterized membrane protein YuzA (DUF378 family) [Gracilibacillus alcaliphilus]